MLFPGVVMKSGNIALGSFLAFFFMMLGLVLAFHGGDLILFIVGSAAFASGATYFFVFFFGKR